MKRPHFGLLVLTSLLSLFVQAQELLVSNNSLHFNNTTVSNRDSIKITFSIQGLITDSVITVKDINVYNKAFSVSDTDFVIHRGESVDLWVYFKPIHNITTTSQLLIVSNAYNSTMSITVTGTGNYSGTYYNATQNLSEQALKDALKTIITTGQTSCTYNGARDQMFMTIDNQKTNGQGAATNTLECIYTGRKAVGYTSRSDAQTNDNFNTEHTWPQSLFSSNAPMVCDLHHLFPTDETANGTRSNYPFGMVTNPTWAVGGSKFANNIFEPRDEQKGRTARAMMYFVLRYQDYSTFFAPQETVLRQWHQQFAPNVVDTKRNEDIFAFQGNRNPFIDHPEFLDRITSLASTSVASPTRLIATDYSPIYFTATSGDMIAFNRGSIALVNTGNQPLNYTATFANHPQFTIIPNTGTILKDSAAKLVFDVSVLSDSITTDTLIIQNNSTNFPNIRIPMVVTYRILAGMDQLSAPTFTFQCFPNPSNNELNILSKSHTEFTISIINLQGQLMVSQRSNSVINTSNLPDGLYLIEGKTADQTYRTKIQIQH